MFVFFLLLHLGLNEILNPEKSPRRKKRHDLSSYEQEIRNKLTPISPIRPMASITTATTPINSSSSIALNSPSESHNSDYLTNQTRPPLSTITPIKSNLSEKTKPRPLTKRMGFKRAVMQKFKITKHNR